MMKRVSLAITAFLVIMILGCTGTASKTPDGTIQMLFKNVKDGKMTSVKSLISSGYLDNFDANKLRDLFGADEVTGIKTEVLEERDQRATVLITLVTKTGSRTGNQPVLLVFQDDSWKIDYSGMSWPTSLINSNY